MDSLYFLKRGEGGQIEGRGLRKKEGSDFFEGEVEVGVWVDTSMLTMRMLAEIRFNILGAHYCE